MISRRGFLGSVLGMLATAEPFLARLAHEPVQKTKLITIPDWRMLFRDTISGFTVQAPGVKEVILKDSSIDFIAHDLDATRRMCINQILVLNRHNAVIFRWKSPYTIHMVNGDTLKAQANMDFDGAPKSLVEGLLQDIRKDVGPDKIAMIDSRIKLA